MLRTVRPRLLLIALDNFKPADAAKRCAQQVTHKSNRIICDESDILLNAAGAWGARMVRIHNTVPHRVFSFVRRNEANTVFAVFNFSAETQTVAFTEGLCYGDFVDGFSASAVAIDATTTLSLPPWGYRVLVQTRVER